MPATLTSIRSSPREALGRRRRSALEVLEQAAGGPWQVLVRREPFGWVEVCADGATKGSGRVLADDESWQQHLEQAYAAQSVLAYELAPGYRVVIAPLPTEFEEDPAVALLDAPVEEQGHVVQLAEMALTIERQRAEIVRLLDEKETDASKTNQSDERPAARWFDATALHDDDRLLVSIVRSLVSAVEAKDAYTSGHSERVALYSKRVAEELGYDKQAAERIYLTGLLHDVGKIGVSDAVLRKPGALTQEEFAEIRRHPDYGWAILCQLRELSYVLPGVLHHHERLDGKGYPDGLEGDAIPLDARVIAVVDAYDAMTSNRAYRHGLPHDRAIEILREGAGVQWDAHIVETFLRIIDEILEIRDNYQRHARPVRRSSITTVD